MSIEGNTPKELANYIRANILSGLLPSQEKTFKAYESTFRSWCDDPYFHSERKWIGMSVLEKGMEQSIGYQKKGGELENLSLVKICQENGRISAEVNYHEVSRVFLLQFGFKPLTSSQIDLVLCALAELVVM